MNTTPLIYLLLTWTATAAEPAINPFPSPALSEEVAEWSFNRGAQGWTAERDCTLSWKAGTLQVTSTGDDPYFHRPMNVAGGPMRLVMRVRSRTAGRGSLYWATPTAPRSEERRRSFRLVHDGKWREYEIRFEVAGRLADLRIDPGTAPGTFEIDRMTLFREQPHPLVIERVLSGAEGTRFEVKNRSSRLVAFRAAGRQYSVAAGEKVTVKPPVKGVAPLEAVSVDILTEKFPPLRRTVFVQNAQAKSDWITRRGDGFTARIADDGSIVRIEREGQLLAFIGPLVHYDGKPPRLSIVGRGDVLRFRGEGVTVDLSIEGKEISIAIESGKVCEGPVVRTIGSLQQGLLAGLEYLGRGERSSSKLDVETEAHLRYAPNALDVTMPLMAFVTDRATVAMTWTDMTLQPTFATPNFFDGADDHRMSLRGKKLQVTVRVDQCPLEEMILWAAKKQGLPPLPKAPRTAEEQWKLCLKAINGPLKGKGGWGHCAGERWARHPYADIASTVWRLTGKAPNVPRIVPNGAHVHNDAIYFVSGRTKEWLDRQRRKIDGIIRRQKPDGSFRYAGKFARGHFEDTASGQCAKPAVDLLEFARITGDAKALAAARRTLDYMQRFRTPRGAQVWEVPLHTPDQLASAYLVWAYTRGYELTGEREYLKQARRWALSGVPFVYLWSRQPTTTYATMAYATVPVYGATNWQAPVWIGLPVQWVGGVYAYALTMLAPHDDSLDWNRLARGILHCAEQMQYPDGPHAGLLPDAFILDGQQRLPARINPCALVSLRLVLDGKLDFLSVASDKQHRVAAPFPVTLRDGKAHIRALRGTKYQVLIDGKKIVDVTSQGDDVVPLR